MPDNQFELNKGKLRLAVFPENGRVSIFWAGTEITRDTGLASIVGHSAGDSFYSERASWQVNDFGPDRVSLLLKWKDQDFIQSWDISIVDQETFTWKVGFICPGKPLVNRHEIGLKLYTDYQRWFSVTKNSFFPKIGKDDTSWKKISSDELKSYYLGVSGQHTGPGNPALIFEFSDVPYPAYPKILNSHYHDSLRALFALVKPVYDSTGSSPGKQDNIFSCRVSLIEDMVRFKAYVETNRKKGRFEYLWRRYLEHYSKGGFFYAFKRGSKYIYYILGLTPVLNSFSPSKLCYFFINTFSPSNLYFSLLGIFYRSTKNKESIEAGRLRLVADSENRSVQIFWDNSAVTSYNGFVGSFSEQMIVPQHFYTSYAFWEVKKPSKRQITITFRWPGIALIQTWSILLEDEHTVSWSVELKAWRNMRLLEVESGILVPAAHFSRWMNSWEQGVFPKINAKENKWVDIPLHNIYSDSLGVSSDTGSERLPSVLFEFGSSYEDAVVKPKIRNSDCFNQARFIMAQVSSSKKTIRLKKKKGCPVFSAKVKILQEADLPGYIAFVREKLYRQRLPFIEEKANRKYLAQPLLPVDVVLANMPWSKDGLCGVRAGSRWPHMKNETEEAYLPFPFFLAYTASLLLANGIKVRVIDAIAEEMEEEAFVKLINELAPRLLIAEVSTPSLDNDLALLGRIDRCRTKIAVCGLDYNIRQPEFLVKNPRIDFSMFGEYERTALELFRELSGAGKFNTVKGLVYRDNGAVKVNSLRPLLQELDSLPWPLREQLPMDKYIDAPGNIATPSVQMIASRGCPFSCMFCAWPQLMYNGNQYRMRGPEGIVDEMEHLVKEWKFKSVYFDDDTFNINKNNVIQICRHIQERGLKIPWAIMARADTMDEEMLMAMKEAGLFSVKYGVESAEQKLLDNIKKGMNLAKAEKMIRFTKSLGIKTHLTFTFGLPQETKDTVSKTIDYAMNLDPDTVQFSILTPYPGTEYFRQLDVGGYIVSKDWSSYDGAYKSVIRTDHLSPGDLEQAKIEALRRWKRHKRLRRSLISMPFDPELKSAFRNHLRTKGLRGALAKTIRYIFTLG